MKEVSILRNELMEDDKKDSTIEHVPISRVKVLKSFHTTSNEAKYRAA